MRRKKFHKLVARLATKLLMSEVKKEKMGYCDRWKVELIESTPAFVLLDSDYKTIIESWSAQSVQFTLNTPNYEKKQQETLVRVAGFQWE